MAGEVLVILTLGVVLSVQEMDALELENEKSATGET